MELFRNISRFPPSQVYRTNVAFLHPCPLPVRADCSSLQPALHCIGRFFFWGGGGFYVLHFTQQNGG